MDFFIIKMGAHSLRFSHHIEGMNESKTEVLLEEDFRCFVSNIQAGKQFLGSLKGTQKVSFYIMQEGRYAVLDWTQWLSMHVE